MGCAVTKQDFHEELRHLLNRACVENESNTPDFVLALFLQSVLDAYGVTVTARDAWFGYKPWYDNPRVEAPGELTGEKRASRGPSAIAHVADIPRPEVATLAPPDPPGIAQDRLDAQLWRDFTRFCGHVAAGDSETVSLGQDDATGDWGFSIGKHTTYYGRSPREVLDIALSDL